jgi:hypothetical protein
VIRSAATEGRAMEEYHHGAGIPFRSGPAGDPGLSRLFDAYRKRMGRDPQHYFCGRRCRRDRRADRRLFGRRVTKLILRSAPCGNEEMLAQTHRLIEEVLPHAASCGPIPARRAPHRRLLFCSSRSRLSPNGFESRWVTLLKPLCASRGGAVASSLAWLAYFV